MTGSSSCTKNSKGAITRAGFYPSQKKDTRLRTVLAIDVCIYTRWKQFTCYRLFIVQRSLLWNKDQWQFTLCCKSYCFHSEEKTHWNLAVNILLQKMQRHSIGNTLLFSYVAASCRPGWTSQFNKTLWSNFVHGTKNGLCKRTVCCLRSFSA